MGKRCVRSRFYPLRNTQCGHFVGPMWLFLEYDTGKRFRTGVMDNSRRFIRTFFNSTETK